MSKSRAPTDKDLQNVLMENRLSRYRFDENGSGRLHFARKILDILVRNGWVDSQSDIEPAYRLLNSLGKDEVVKNKYIEPNGVLTPF